MRDLRSEVCDDASTPLLLSSSLDLQTHVSPSNGQMINQKVKIDEFSERNGDNYKRIEELEKQVEV
jgi:hypothetical protein